MLDVNLIFVGNLVSDIVDLIELIVESNVVLLLGKKVWKIWWMFEI